MREGRRLTLLWGRGTTLGVETEAILYDGNSILRKLRRSQGWLGLVIGIGLFLFLLRKRRRRFDARHLVEHSVGLRIFGLGFRLLDRLRGGFGLKLGLRCADTRNATLRVTKLARKLVPSTAFAVAFVTENPPHSVLPEKEETEVDVPFSVDIGKLPRTIRPQNI